MSQVTSLSLSGSTLTLALSDPTSLSFTAGAVSVTVGGNPCTVNTASPLTALTCQMTKNSDNSPILIAGSTTPVVFINNIGIAALQPSVSPLSTTLTATALDIITGGNNGGYFVTLTGKGFPSSAKQINISICNSLATIKTITNIQIVFYMPGCPTLGVSTLTVTAFSQNDTSLSFNYTDAAATAPTIISLSPSSFNPGMKGVLQINGNSFGANLANVKVFLSNPTGKIYTLTILSLNNTSIRCGLGGGFPGTYKVQVNVVGLGDSIAASANSNVFSYAVTITSISPSSGSYNGGTLLTITGTNFNPAKQQTLIYVGNTLDWFCTPQSITTTQIKCRTPTIAGQYNPGQPQKVITSTRLVVFSTCPGNNCLFTYLPLSSSPNITALSASNTNVGNVTITGANLLDSNSFAEVVLVNIRDNSTIVLPAATSSATSIVFTVTANVVADNYLVRVRNLVGQSNGLPLSVNLNPGTASWASGGSRVGGRINITNGAGYPSSFDGKLFYLTLTAGGLNYPVTIISCCNGNNVTLEVPPNANDNTAFVITYFTPVGSNRPTRTYTVKTSLTPLGSITSATTLTNGANTITVTKSNTVIVDSISSINVVSVIDPKVSLPVTSFTNTANATSITINADLPSGSYRLQIRTLPNGDFNITNVLNVSSPSDIAGSTIQSSFAGGLYQITGTKLSPASYITVNGQKGTIRSYTPSLATYNIPPLITADVQTTLKIAKIQQVNLSLYSYFSDSAVSNVTAAFDGLINTIYGSTNAACFLGVDFGSASSISIDRFKFFPYLAWNNAANYTVGAKFEGSNDNTAWTTLATVDQTVHNGWNILKSSSQTGYRYIRFSHNSQSQCNLGEIQLFGIVYTTVTGGSLTSQISDVIYNDGFNTFTVTGGVQYRQDKTPIINQVSPRYGDVYGGYPLTLTGINLDNGSPVITIDGVNCAVTTSTATQIVCTVGNRTTTPTVQNTFVVSIGAKNVILRDRFLYVLKWSDSKTWGVDQPPIDDDLVAVPTGLTLMVDQDTPVLKGIVVDGGRLVFSDDKPSITVRTGFITLNKGQFIAGTEAFPYQNKLNFILYGGYYAAQQPMFGNKGIGCLNCKFSMYGKPRVKTWTTLSATVLPNANTFTVTDTTDWAVGQEIVVASTSFLHTQAQRRKITAVSGNTFTVDRPFMYKHVSQTQTYAGGQKLVMMAQVGLLTRNIKMRGDDETSVAKNYGSHLMLTGTADKGFEGHVAYTQFFHCGQPQILGRYCIHFHMAGQVPTSFARGNAVHDSFARVITIHGVQYLTVEYNVGYRVHGHNFFVEDGIQTHNTIRHNLAMGSLSVSNMLQTDFSVASFWITNPTNDFYGNRAAGSDFYGIWYQVKPNPDGPSATNDVCPMGNPLGYVSDNVAHSNTRFGLRIFHLYSRTYPCNPPRNDLNDTDPWADNPSITSTYQNFIIYKNLENGVLAENVGNVVFKNFTIAENYRSGIQFYVANFTKEPPRLLNSVVIGQSQTNAHANTSNYTNGMSGAITGRSGLFALQNVSFRRFPAGSLLLRTCVLCDDLLKYTNLGTQIQTSGLKFDEVNGSLLFMIGLKRDVIYDLDGSLAQKFDGTTRTSATIVHGWNHIAGSNQNTCVFATDRAAWDDAVACGPTIMIKRVIFTNLINWQLFKAQYLRTVQISTVDQLAGPDVTPNTSYTQVKSWLPDMQPKKQKPYSYSLPFIVGRIYSVWWGTGIDFSHLSIFSTPRWTTADKGIIFKFSYIENRQMFEIGPMKGGKLLTSSNFLNPNTNHPDPNTCLNGQYYHNNSQTMSQRMITICQSGKGKSQFQYTQVNGIMCRYLCPAPAGTFIKESFIRRWSNTSQWPNGALPAAGQNVTVNGNWTIILDIDPSPANYLIIDGTVIADDTRDVNITAKSILIRAGTLLAGTSTKPFEHKLTIQINGIKNQPGFIVSPTFSSTKYFAITGSLNLFGKAPATVQTFLKSSAMVGATTLNVGSSTDWAVGDTLVISPSFGNYAQHQKVTITAINADGSVNITPALLYNHYGATTATITNSYGSIDTRAYVGHVTRNIKIVPGPQSDWGFTTVVHGFLDGQILRKGSAIFQGVQFVSGGQLDTLNSPLVFLNTVGATSDSLVTKSSFVKCKANCITLNNADKISITNNVLYDIWVFGTQAINVKTFTYTNNLIIGVYQKPTLNPGDELVACFVTLSYIDPAVDQVTIKNNLCLGSNAHGFAFPHTKCSELQQNPMANNTVGSAKIGFIINTIGSEQCQGFSYAKAYACGIGQISGAPGISSIRFSKFFMVDNGRGVSLKHGDREGRSNHTAFLQDSYINAISRPTCTYCYGTGAIDCNGNQGVRLYTPSANGQVMPKKYGSGFDVICKQPVYGGQSFIRGCLFQNFRQTYASLAQCSSNFAFKPHGGAFDFSASANLYGSTCTNCDTNSILQAQAPSAGHLGWFGGCGQILCTGFNNYLINDFDGTFFGFKGTVIANNSVIGNSYPSCTHSPAMNSHICTQQIFDVLQYQSIAPDFKTRQMWPITLKYDGANYSTLTNAWRQWQWLGNQPQNQRFGRFVSIIENAKYYNMSFTSQPPIDMQFQLQKRHPLGDNSRYTIIRIYYPLPNAIKVSVNGNVVKPILLTDFAGTGAPGLQQNLDTTKCGSNIYFYTNYTISFVVTGAQNCLVRVYLSDTVQLTTHFSMNITDFFDNSNKLTNFVNNLAALLNIQDTSRIKVVGIFSGSTTITTLITAPETPVSTDPTANTTNTTNTTTPSTQPSMAAVTAAISGAISSGTFAAAISPGVAAPSTVLGSSFVFTPLPAVTPINNPTTNPQQSSKTGLIIGVAVGSVVILVGSFATVLHCLRKRAKIVQEIVSYEDEHHIEKMNEKPHFMESSDLHHDSEIKIKHVKQGDNLKIHEFNDYNNGQIIDA